MIAAGANVNCENKNGDTPLKICIIHNKCDHLKVLLDAGADVNPSSYSPIMMCFSNTSQDVLQTSMTTLQLLVDYGANLYYNVNDDNDSDNGWGFLHNIINIFGFQLDLSENIIKLITLYHVKNSHDLNDDTKPNNILDIPGTCPLSNYRKMTPFHVAIRSQNYILVKF